MRNDRRAIRILAALSVALGLAGRAAATQVQDLVRVKGAERSKLIGTGLVTGLPGTGDGKSASAMRQMTELLKRTGDPTAVASELKNLKNVAIVTVSATIPDSGVREGDLIDVHVTSWGGAKSLAGGRLFLTQLLGPKRGMGVYAMAEGPVTVEDEQAPTVGVVKGGAQMVRSVRTQCVKDGRLTLVLRDSIANWPMANEVAGLINSVMAPEGPKLARAEDGKTIVVEVPDYEQADPATFITTILTSYVDSAMVNTGAVVTVNEKTGVILVGGDVEISPILLRVEGLTITTIASPQDEQAAAAPPEPEEQPFVKIDPRNSGGAKLSDLMAALNQLKISPQACINVIRAIDRSGKLHARLIEE